MFDVSEAAAKATEHCRTRLGSHEAVARVLAELNDAATPLPRKKRLLVNLGIVAGEPFIGPQTIHLDIIGICNLNCLYCRDHSPLVTDREPWREMEMPFELISDLIDEGLTLGTSVIPFLGAGEPLMHTRFSDIIRKIKGTPMQFEIFTNGLLFTPEVLDLFTDAHRGRLHFSLSAVDEATYKKYRPGLSGEPLATIESNIRHLVTHREPGLRLIVVHVMNNLNSSQTVPMMERAIELGVDEIQYKLTEYGGFSQGMRLSVQELASIEDELRHVKNLAAQTGVDVHDNIDFQLAHVNPATGNYAEGLFDELGCHLGWELVRIRRDGEISFCCALKFLDHLEGKKLSDYWYGPRMRAARLAARGFPRGKNLEIPGGQMLKDHQCDYCYNYIFNFHSRDELTDLGLLSLVEAER